MIVVIIIIILKSTSFLVPPAGVVYSVITEKCGGQICESKVIINKHFPTTVWV